MSRPNRRNFLKGAAASGAVALAAKPQTAAAQEVPSGRGASAPSATARETETSAPAAEVLTADRPGGDFMTDVLKSLGFEYILANPGSSFRGLHESIVNYGGNKNPEFITCCHEESSVAMAHGYSKIEGKPGCVFAHGTVGLQHAAMALYNAYCDRAPVYVIVGNTVDAVSRRPGVEWEHSVQDAASLVRDFTKWDDLPASLPHFAESAVRAYKVAMTPPMMPVLLVADGDLQENPHPEAWPHIPNLTLARPPQGDAGSVAEVARWLVNAENPVLVAGRVARTPAGLRALIELAETLQAPVIDQNERMNFPTRHGLNQSSSRGLIAQADVIVGLELTDFWGTVNSYRDQLHRTSRRITKPDAKLVSITTGDLFIKANYQDFERFPEVDMAIAADAEETLPALTEAVKRLITADRKRAFEARGVKLAAGQQKALEAARAEATYGWEASPISTARLAAEVWGQIQNKDWSLVSGSGGWPSRLWAFDKHYQHIGSSGGAGVGYGAPASLGAALANRKYGRLSVSIQNDGDLMYAPGVLWTAAHHKIPLLTIMHNNRAYHQEVMHVQRVGNSRNRGVDRAHIGTTITDPFVDYAKLAQSMSMAGFGPIIDPKDLAPTLKRAITMVKAGEPVLVDVVTQPR